MNTTIKRIIAIILAVMMITALVGCSKGKREVVQLTLSTEDAEAILRAAGIVLPDPETAAGANSVVQWFSWYDPFQNYSEDEIMNTGYYTFQEKYGGKVDWIEVEWGQRYDGVANLILSGDPPDLYPGEANTFPNFAIKGLYDAVNKYIDYNDPLWADMKDYAYKYFSLGDNVYMMVTDRSFGTVCPYNKRVMDEWGFDDPAELFYNDEWTWDVFTEMCMEFSDPDEDRYALDGWYFYKSILRGTGSTIVSYDPNTNHFVSNLDLPGFDRAADMLYNLSVNNCMYPWYANGWACRNSSIEGGGVRDGSCLFWPVSEWGFTGTVEEISAVWGDMTEGELMFVPLPRDPNGDGNYYLESSPNGYCIIKSCKNPDGVALLVSCMRFKAIDPTVVDIDRKQLKEVYLWNQDMLDMHDYLQNLVDTSDYLIMSYDAGMGDMINDTVGTIEGFSHSRNVSTWAQVKEANADKLQYAIDELNATVDAFIASGGEVNAQNP